jgi:hypothetical protein
VACNDAAALGLALQQLRAEQPVRRAYDLSAFAQGAKVAEVEAFYRRELAALR